MNTESKSATSRIQYVSSAAPVNMGDDWYYYATPDHFWMWRRFQVFQKLAVPDGNAKWAEVGCGNGAVQLQMNQQLNTEVDGIELNQYALQRNISDRGRLLCYNVLDEEPSMKESYDNLILFDVLEHITDDHQFLKSVLFLLKPEGSLIINVPAFQHLWSAYDEAQGHVRRYRINDLAKLVDRQANCLIRRWTYWGAPFVPLLFGRKVCLKFSHPNKVIQTGFAVSSRILNGAFRCLSRCERIPQRVYGTSLMLVIDKQG